MEVFRVKNPLLFKMALTQPIAHVHILFNDRKLNTDLVSGYRTSSTTCELQLFCTLRVISVCSYLFLVVNAFTSAFSKRTVKRTPKGGWVLLPSLVDSFQFYVDVMLCTCLVGIWV